MKSGRHWTLIIVAAAMAALAGCGTNGTGAAPSASPSSTVSPTPSPSITPLPSITPPPAAGNDAAGKPSAAPVTSRSRAYIKSSGEKGEFSGAVLERGQDACQRVGYIGQIDRGQLIAGLAAGEIGAAAGAIPFLCPKYNSALAQAKHGFVDGTVSVGRKYAYGKTVRPGIYETDAGSAACEWRIVDSRGLVLDHGEAKNAWEHMSMTVGKTAAKVVSRGCGVWLPKES